MCFFKKKVASATIRDGIKNVTIFAGFFIKTNEKMPPTPLDVQKAIVLKMAEKNAEIALAVMNYMEKSKIPTVSVSKIPKPSDHDGIEKFVRKNCKSYPAAACYYASGDPFGLYIFIIEFGGSKWNI